MSKNKTEDSKSRTGKTYSDKVLESMASDMFAGCCDGISFGVDQGGVPFNTSSSNREWDKEQWMRWAIGNAMFFEYLGRKLRMYAAAVDKFGKGSV